MKKNIGNVAGAGTSANVTKNVSRRALAAVLALVFALSCFLGLNFALRAKGADWADSDMEGAKEVNKGLVLNKGLRQNGDTYEVRLEAKATGSAVNQSLAKNSPLDVVVVKKDGGDKMETEDVVSQYNPIDASPLTIADIQQGEYYVKVGDKYREVKTKEFYKAAPENLDSFPGTAKASWTAQSAHDWVYADPDNPRHLYYGDNHKMVFAAPDVTFSERLSSISVLGSEVSHTTTDPTYGTTNYFVYVPHTGTGADDKSAWHRLYYQQNYEDVWLSRNDKYYYTFFYFKDSVEKVGNWPNISSGTAGKTVGSVVLLNNFKSCGCSGNTTYSSINGYTSSFTNNNTNTTNGKLYTFSNQNTTKNYNILYVENSDNSYFYLACQDISDTNTSHTYNGTLETKAHRLYYLGDNGEETLGEVWNTTDKPYDGTLYTADKISRTAAMESAIEAFQDQLNANGLYDADHYKEVSYSGDNLGTGLSAAESWFSEHNCSESRKKIIVLFSDDVASPDTAIAQRLKDNEVTIYTVGLYPSGTVDSTVRDNLKKVSSETFKGSSASASGTFNYSATDKTSLIKHYTSIANAVTQPSTTLVLGRDTVLKDIISENFVTDLEKRGKTKVTIETVDAEGKVTSNPSGVEYAWEADEKTLTVTGFDYCKNPNTTLRVTITGLEKVYDVKKSIENNQEVIYSNDPNSGIYYDGGRALLAAFPMPSIPYNEETAAAPELHSMNVAIREQFATLTDIVSTLSGNATFQAELLEVDGVSAENSEQWDYDPAIYDRTVELPAVTLSTKVSDYDDNDGIADSHEWSTDRIFPDGNVYAENPAGDARFTFPHAGVYLYKVTQKDISVGTPKPDETKYFMKVFVRNSDKKNGEDANGLYIENITVRKGTEAEAEKVNYTTDGSAANGFVFQNKYFPESKGALTVTKELVASDEGNPVNEADTQQVFEFELVVTLSDIVAERTNFSLPDISNDGRFTSREVRHLNGEDSPITMIYGKLRLKAGESLTLDKLPMNAHYVFEETGIPKDTEVELDEGTQIITEVTPIPASEEDANSAGISYFCEDPSQNGAMKNETELATITNYKVAFVMPEPEGISKNVSLGLAGGLIALILLTAGIFFLRSELKKEQ